MKIVSHILGGKVGNDAVCAIGASMYALEISTGGKKYCFLIDAGMETVDDGVVSWRGPQDLERLEALPLIDAVFLTHAHRDHVAALLLPEIRNRMRPNAKIIGTQTTHAFFLEVLYDQHKVSSAKGEAKPYELKDIVRLTQSEQCMSVDRPMVLDIKPGKISVLVWPAGHIRGACSFIFRVREGAKEVKIMYTGDYALHDQMTTRAAPLPPEGWMPDIIASFDATNGAEDLRPWKDEVVRMADDGNTAVKSGSWFFASAFAMDRCQTCAAALSTLGLPVWLDGKSAIGFSRIMRSADGMWCGNDMPLTLAGVRSASYYGEPMDYPEPSVIVAPSGMGHGPATDYLIALLERENAVIGMTGYLAPGTNGQRVVSASRGARVTIERGIGAERESIPLTVAARVEQYRLTAHALREDALRRIAELLSRSTFRARGGKPIVALAHGTAQAFTWFERALAGSFLVLRADNPRDRVVEFLI